MAQGASEALFAACRKDHIDELQQLLEEGADVNQTDKDGTTPLYAACLRSNVDAVRLLLEKGAEVNWEMAKRGVTPLHFACVHCNVDVVRLLLDKGAAVDLARWDGATPLSIAKYQGHSSIVALLEDHLYKALDDEAARKRQRLGPRADMGRRLPRAGPDPRGRVAPAIRAAPAQIPEGTFVI